MVLGEKNASKKSGFSFFLVGGVSIV